MGRHSSRKNRAVRSARRPSITMVLIALAVFAVGAATVVSRQSLSATGSTTATSTLKNASSQDPTLSLTERPTQQDRDGLADGLKEMINQSTEGLAEIQHSDGSVSVNLEDRFQSVTVAKDSNGRLSQSCVDNPQAAGAFFNIDPKLIDNKSRALVAPATKE